MHYPSDSLQPGPIYFLTPRKCMVFGINYEALLRQVNFLTDEAGDCGKGANTVFSRIHFFFKHHGLGETEVYLHADNCCGQNKNTAMIQYLVWCMLRGTLASHCHFSLLATPNSHLIGVLACSSSCLREQR